MLVLVDAGELHIQAGIVDYRVALIVRGVRRRGQFLLFDILRDLRAPGMATGREAEKLKAES